MGDIDTKNPVIRWFERKAAEWKEPPSEGLKKDLKNLGNFLQRSLEKSTKDSESAPNSEAADKNQPQPRESKAEEQPARWKQQDPEPNAAWNTALPMPSETVDEQDIVPWTGGAAAGSTRSQPRRSEVAAAVPSTKTQRDEVPPRPNSALPPGTNIAQPKGAQPIAAETPNVADGPNVSLSDLLAKEISGEELEAIKRMPSSQLQSLDAPAPGIEGLPTEANPDEDLLELVMLQAVVKTLESNVRQLNEIELERKSRQAEKANPPPLGAANTHTPESPKTLPAQEDAPPKVAPKQTKVTPSTADDLKATLKALKATLKGISSLLSARAQSSENATRQPEPRAPTVLKREPEPKAPEEPARKPVEVPASGAATKREPIAEPILGTKVPPKPPAATTSSGAPANASPQTPAASLPPESKPQSFPTNFEAAAQAKKSLQATLKQTEEVGQRLERRERIEKSRQAVSALLAKSPQARVRNTERITEKQLRDIAPNMPTGHAAKQILHHLNRSMVDAGINTILLKAAYIAQLAHESKGFTKMREEASGDAYQGRMGNDKPGDGKRYRGVGPLQVTGKKNLKKAKDDLGVDFIKNPERGTTYKDGFDLASWYWNTNNINKHAANAQFDKVTKLINNAENGPKTHADVRWALYLKALQVLLRDFQPGVAVESAKVPEVPAPKPVTKSPGETQKPVAKPKAPAGKSAVDHEKPASKPAGAQKEPVKKSPGEAAKPKPANATKKRE